MAHFGGRHNPVVIDDDDVPDDPGLADRALAVAREQQVALWRAVERAAGQDLVDLTEEEGEFAREDIAEQLLFDGIAEVIDLTEDEPVRGTRPRGEVRGGPGGEGNQHLSRWVRDAGLALEVGMVVELHQPIAKPFTAHFVRVAEITHSASGEVSIRGTLYARARHMLGLVGCKRNEVVMLQRVFDADADTDGAGVLTSIQPANVKRVRLLRTTNERYPVYRCSVDEVQDRGEQWISENCVLVCRFKYIEHFHEPNSKKPCEWELVRISEDEADRQFRVRSINLLNTWRGGKIRGGSWTPQGVAIPVSDTEEPLDDRLRLAPGQRYSAGDTFSGAGGAARGMERAGLRLIFTIDIWDAAVRSLQQNFPATDILPLDVSEFIKSVDREYRVDMLHLSPPCQVWSPAHTVAGKNDDDNTAALFACADLLWKVRPRLFTLEQTFGILHEYFQPYFHKLLQGFTDLGYSIRWKVVLLATYGLPQPRRRLIIIGAGPGETLPTFPPPTHSRDRVGGLLPLVTARQALAPLARRRLGDDPMHTVPARGQRHKEPWNPDQPLPRTITCNGGQNYHWSGKRDFTHLEYALLQGFPPYHQFSSTYVKKQIGNAFASSVVKVFYKHLAAHLDRCDNVDASTRAKAPLPPHICIEDYLPPIELSDTDPDALVVDRVVRKRRRTAKPSAVGSAHKTRRLNSDIEMYENDPTADGDPMYLSDSGAEVGGPNYGADYNGFPPIRGRRRRARTRNPIVIDDDDDEDKSPQGNGKAKEIIAINDDDSGGHDNSDHDADDEAEPSAQTTRAKTSRAGSRQQGLQSPSPTSPPDANRLIRNHIRRVGGLFPRNQGTLDDPFVIPEE